MAAGGYKTWSAGDVLTAADTNDFLMQGVLVFGGTAARASAIPSPVEGQITFRTDDDALEYYDGSAWQAVSGGVSSATISDTPTGSYTGYQYWTYTASGTLTVTEAGFVDVLIIGGGAGGGQGGLSAAHRGGGGGGAGSYVSYSNLYLPAATHTVTVGAGGATNLPGSESLLVPIVATGGGAGGRYSGNVYGGFYGGSGGGGVGSTAGGDGLSGRGNDGGTGTGTGAGGGGGAGAGGSSSSTYAGAAGGDGTSSSITGSAVTRGGGGGGGGGTPSWTGGAGGSGGGGAGGGYSSVGTAGTANTGGGGGGGGANEGSTVYSGGNGGSGIVIVRVAV